MNRSIIDAADGRRLPRLRRRGRRALDGAHRLPNGVRQNGFSFV